MGSVKAVFKFLSDEYKERLSSFRCLLTISVGQEAHEGEKLKATFDLVNRSFNSCIIMIDDTLQRYTMALNSQGSPESFYEVSLQEGNFWLARNKKIYAGSGSVVKNIFRWDEWLHHVGYQNQKNRIEGLLNTDQAYRDAFQKSIDEFLRRYSHRESAFDLKRAEQLCLSYLIEECASFCLWVELNCHFDVYPSIRNAALSATYERFILPCHPDQLRPLAIKFKNRKQFKPQTFDSLCAVKAASKDVEEELVE